MLCESDAAPKPNLYGLKPLRVLHREAVLQRLPGVAADDVRNAARRVAQQHRHQISKLANSSFGDSSGCVSDVPLSCLISISGSLRTRDAA